MKKLPASLNIVAVPFVLSLLMSGIISMIATLRTLGVTPDLFSTWIKTWGLSWLVAFPTVFVVLPLVRKIVAALVEAPGPRK